MSMNSPFQIFCASFGGTSTPPGETAGGGADGWGAGGAAGLTPMWPRGVPVGATDSWVSWFGRPVCGMAGAPMTALGIPVPAWYRGAPWAGCCPRLPMWYDRAPWPALMGGAVPAGRLTTGFWPVATRPGCALLGTVNNGVGPARLNTGTLAIAIGLGM